MGIRYRQLASERSGAVRAVVIHHKHVGVRHRDTNTVYDAAQVLPLVIRRNNDHYRAIQAAFPVVFIVGVVSCWFPSMRAGQAQGGGVSIHVAFSEDV